MWRRLLMLAATLGAAWLAGATATSGSQAVQARGPGSPWGADYFPNVPLFTHEGRTVRFFDDLLAGKVVAINFIFTTCSAACPMETARLREVQQLLGDRVGKDVFFYSITIDPLNDTPDALAAYARKFDAAPGWLFLTGKWEDITLLRRKLGVYIEGLENGTSKDHNLSLVIGNQQTGRWSKASPFENPYMLAEQLGGSLHNWKTAAAKKNDYADAPALRTMPRGEELFRTRCSSCHAIGARDGALASMRRIGPDLAGITQLRERAWLVRWLKEPDRVLAEKDPLAVALFEQYGRLPMPNLQLSDGDVQALLDYLAYPQGDRQRAATRAPAGG